MELKEGAKAPSFSALDDQGNKVSLKDFAGEPVVLYFYPKDNTPGCTQEACEFQSCLGKLQKQGIKILGVSKDTVETHQKFKKKYALTFPLLADPDHELCLKYGVWKEKNMYGKKVFGIVRTTILIDREGKMSKIYSKVKVDGHVDQVLKDLKALEL